MDVRSLLTEEAERSPLHTQDLQQLDSGEFGVHVAAFESGMLTLQLWDLGPIWYHGGLHYYVMVNLRKDVRFQNRVLKVREYFRYRQVVLADGRNIILADFCRENDDLHNVAQWFLECYYLEDKDRAILKLLPQEVSVQIPVKMIISKSMTGGSTWYAPIIL